METSNERELWQQFQAGDEQAFSTIYSTYFSILYQYGYHIAQDEALVKDCIQTLFIEIWRSRRNLATDVSIKFYLLKAMRRHVYRTIRLQASFVSATALDETNPVTQSFSHEFELIAQETTQQRQALLQQAIHQLTNRQREAITLLYINELSYAEIAGIMTLKTRSVYNLIHEALEKLRSQLNPSNFTWLVFVLFSLVDHVQRIPGVEQ
ncbi:RNA polymerase sigma factor [Spirosoma agri]|uniref:RNA polymerase sigma factor n=1 Tax=Spirosoma agri TaxID=1987381 RepID=A0A6M0IRQ0_9BACT|nr:RNA polymerase sigma factor [Spirosoma agri]NEU70940.1 RNA polymerase sigma factor [Spirosoma agri]